MPRHPPCALTNLTTKMLASTVQFSSNGRPQLCNTAYQRTRRRFSESWSCPRHDHTPDAPKSTGNAVPNPRRDPAVTKVMSPPPPARGRTRRCAPEPALSGPVPSGPNSVPRCHRASPVPFPPAPLPKETHPLSTRRHQAHPPKEDGCTRNPSARRAPTGQCSTRELHPRSERPERGPGRHPQPPEGCVRPPDAP